MGGRVVLGGRIGHGCEGWLFVLSDEMVFKHLDIVQLGQSLTLKLVYTTHHPPTTNFFPTPNLILFVSINSVQNFKIVAQPLLGEKFVVGGGWVGGVNQFQC